MLFNSLRDASVDSLIVGLEPRLPLIGPRHLVEELLPTRMRVSETSLGPTVLLHMLALLAVGVVVAIFLQVRHIDPQLSDDWRLNLLRSAGASWRIVEVG